MQHRNLERSLAVTLADAMGGEQHRPRRERLHDAVAGSVRLGGVVRTNRRAVDLAEIVAAADDGRRRGRSVVRQIGRGRSSCFVPNGSEITHSEEPPQDGVGRRDSAGKMLASTAINIAPTTINVTVSHSTIVGIFRKTVDRRIEQPADPMMPPTNSAISLMYAHDQRTQITSPTPAPTMPRHNAVGKEDAHDAPAAGAERFQDADVARLLEHDHVGRSPGCRNRRPR